MPVPVGSYSSGPTCSQKVKTGIFTGFCIGLVSGCFFGGISSYRFGYRGRELITNVAKMMLQGGGTFATFMGVGSIIRC